MRRIPFSFILAFALGIPLNAQDGAMGGDSCCGKSPSSGAPASATLPAPMAFLAGYFDAVRALAADDDTAALCSLKKLQDDVKAAKGLKNQSKVQKTVADLVAAKNIKEIRKNLDALSRLVEAWCKDNGYDKQGVNFFYCPMAKGNWASLDSEVANPYYGQAMLTCGMKVSAPQ